MMATKLKSRSVVGMTSNRKDYSSSATPTTTTINSDDFGSEDAGLSKPQRSFQEEVGQDKSPQQPMKHSLRKHAMKLEGSGGHPRRSNSKRRDRAGARTMGRISLGSSRSSPSVITSIREESLDGHDANMVAPVSRPLVNHDSIVAVLHDFYDDLNSNSESKSVECWKVFYEKYHDPNYMMIRPSGNPCTSSTFIDMFCSEDIKLLGLTLVSVDSCIILAGGKSAVATYTVDQKFTYRQNYNEDRCVVTCILNECNGDIKIVHEQRTEGQPIPKQSRWAT